MSEWIGVIGTLAGGVFGFFASEYLQSRSRKFQLENEYRAEIKKHFDDIIKPLFVLIQEVWGSLATLQVSITMEEGNLRFSGSSYKDVVQDHRALKDFIHPNYELLSLLFPSPFPWVFAPLNELIENILEKINDNENPNRDISKAVNTLWNMQKDLRKLVGYEIDIKLETKYPFE